MLNVVPAAPVQFAKIASGQTAVLVGLVEKVADFVTVPPVSSRTWDL